MICPVSKICYGLASYQPNPHSNTTTITNNNKNQEKKQQEEQQEKHYEIEKRNASPQSVGAQPKPHQTCQTKQKQAKTEYRNQTKPAKFFLEKNQTKPNQEKTSYADPCAEQLLTRTRIAHSSTIRMPGPNGPVIFKKSYLENGAS